MSLLLLMAWVASCDGEVADDEVREIRSIIGTGPAADYVPELFALIRGGDLGALEIAAQIIRTSVAPERRRLLLQLVIRIALADVNRPGFPGGRFA